MNYKAMVSYDGTRYEGWQKHEGKETIQGKLETVIGKLVGEDVAVMGAGRTDAGVHAKGQVFNFHVPALYDVAALEKEINDSLPDDISINGLKRTEERFHSRFHAKVKTYVYALRVGSEKDVFRRRFVWQYGKPLDRKAMEKALPYLIGVHDFTAFTSQKKMKKSAVREIFSIRITEEKGVMEITFKGDGFLQHMIRILVGTLVEIGEGKRNAEALPAVLESKNRSLAGFTAPPQGLTLLHISYE